MSQTIDGADTIEDGPVDPTALLTGHGLVIRQAFRATVLALPCVGIWNPLVSL